MVQFFFFLSMLTIAALMIQLFWYLEDSHREEDRVTRSRNPARTIRQSNAGAFSVNHIESTTVLSANYPIYRVQPAQSNKRTTANQSSNHFYNVGTEIETQKDYSTSMNQDQCA